METLANLESFVRSAEHGSFSQAARHLGLTPAAVSRNVAMLERNLGVRLFHRSTRKLTLSEAGEAFRIGISDNLESIQAAIARIAARGGEATGTLKLSVPPTVGVMHILPLLKGFRARYPLIRPEWHFETRQVDVIGEGYDVAIGGGFERSAGLVVRALAPAHIIAVAAPSYVKRRKRPAAPDELRALDGIVMRSAATGRIRLWTMRDAKGRQMAAPLAPTLVVDDPAAMREAALLGLGVALTATADVVPALDAGALVRLVPRWYADAGSICICYASREHLAAKTRVFVDWVSEAFRKHRLAERLTASATP